MTAEDKKHAIFRALVEEIVSGKFQIGSRLPTDRELAARFGTSRINVFRALEQLKQQGIIISRKRAGTVVVAMPDAGESQQLLNDSSRVVYCLKSATPHFIHWNDRTFTAMEERLSGAGLRVHYLTIPGRREDLLKIIEESMRTGAAGLTIFPDSEDSDFLNFNSDLLIDVSTPIFMLNRGNDISRLDFVNSVNMDNMGDAIRMGVLLRKNGFKRMLIPGANVYSSCIWHKNRITGLELGFQGAETTRPEYPAHNRFEMEFCLDRALADKELILTPLHPMSAAELMDTAEKRGLVPGSDFNLVTFDDDPAFAGYELTSTKVRHAAVGDMIGKLLLNSRKDRDESIWNSIRIAGELIQRTSCRKLEV